MRLMSSLASSRMVRSAVTFMLKTLTLSPAYTDSLDHLGLHMEFPEHIKHSPSQRDGRNREEYDVLLGSRNCIIHRRYCSSHTERRQDMRRYAESRDRRRQWYQVLHRKRPHGHHSRGGSVRWRRLSEHCCRRETRRRHWIHLLLSRTMECRIIDVIRGFLAP